jgi:hypothetical protein
LQIKISTAREWLRIGRALSDLTELDRALADGRLSYSKVRALSRVATAKTEEELITLAQRVPAGRLHHAIAAWQMRRETPAETAERQHRLRRLSYRVDADGMTVWTVKQTPLAAAAMRSAVDAYVLQHKNDASADASRTGRWPSFAQQRADALEALVTGGGANIMAEVVLHVRADGCTLDDGTPIAGSLVERIAPYAFIRALIHDAERRPINASGRQRHPTLRQKRVVHERDRVCVDCGSSDFLQFDHEPPFNETKHTIIDELVNRCTPCHDARHKSER